MKFFSRLIATLVVFGILGCGEQPAAQKKATTDGNVAPGPAKPTEAAPAPPPPPPAADAKK